jgi:hypothetical protein
MGEQTKGGSDPYCRPKIGENCSCWVLHYERSSEANA